MVNIRKVLALGLIAGAACLGACAKNAATGRSYINALSREEEIAIGEENMPQMIEAYGGKITDPAMVSYVDRIGRELASHTEGDYPSMPWEFTVLNSDVINAFALPGGKVFISRALAEEMTTESQLAGVLGHEIGHVTAQHADQRMARQYGLALAAAVAGAVASQSDAGWAPLLAEAGIMSGGVFTLRYDRNEESESDALGMRYMAKAGYNPAGQLEVMKILARASEGGGGQPEFLSTHPYPETRIKQIEKALATEYAYTQNNPEYGDYESRFRTQMLNKLKAMPPAPKVQTGMLVPMSGWCAICGQSHGGVAEGEPSAAELAGQRRIFASASSAGR